MMTPITLAVFQRNFINYFNYKKKIIDRLLIADGPLMSSTDLLNLNINLCIGIPTYTFYNINK